MPESTATNAASYTTSWDTIRRPHAPIALPISSEPMNHRRRTKASDFFNSLLEVLAADADVRNRINFFQFVSQTD